MPKSDLMALPEGLTCADCFHFKHCLAMIGPDAINDKATRCDFSPRRFVAHHERLSAARQEIADQNKALAYLNKHNAMLCDAIGLERASTEALRQEIAELREALQSIHDSPDGARETARRALEGK